MIRYIEVEGVTRPFLFSYRALKDLKSKGPAGLDAIDYAAYLGFKYGELKVEGKSELTHDNVLDWIDEDLGLLSQVSEIIEEVTEEFSKAVEGKPKGSKK